MKRRRFLTTLLAVPSSLRAAKELDCDVAVIGGGVGGCAAALAALRNRMRVILTEETDWIGGQLTSQARRYHRHATRFERQQRRSRRNQLWLSGQSWSSWRATGQQPGDSSYSALGR